MNRLKGLRKSHNLGTKNVEELRTTVSFRGGNGDGGEEVGGDSRDDGRQGRESSFTIRNIKEEGRRSFEKFI